MVVHGQDGSIFGRKLSQKLFNLVLTGSRFVWGGLAVWLVDNTITCGNSPRLHQAVNRDTSGNHCQVGCQG